MSRILLILATLLALSSAHSFGSQTSTARAWVILQQGLKSHRAEERANAVHALRLLPHNPRAQEMAENALTDQCPTVRAAAARALGPMGSVSSAPKLKAVLNDKEPAVVLAAARSRFMLGEREEPYEIDYEVLTGERKSANGFVKSQINELKDPKADAMIGVETGIGSCRSAARSTNCSKEFVRMSIRPYERPPQKSLPRTATRRLTPLSPKPLRTNSGVFGRRRFSRLPGERTLNYCT
jgi:hypothetical protein